MGTYGIPGQTGTHAEIDAELMRPFWSGGGVGVGVHIEHTDCRLVKFNRHYNIIRENGVPVGIAVALIQRDPHRPEWFYKPISDEMGPCEVDCPLDLIDIADAGKPVDGYALEWRQRVRDYHAANKAASTRGLRVGDIITLRDGLSIKGEARVFEIRRNTPHVRMLETGVHYRVNRKYIAAFRHTLNDCRDCDTLNHACPRHREVPVLA